VLRLSLDDFDAALLPEGDRDPKSLRFADAVAAVVRTLWRPMGGEALVTAAAGAVEVEWTAAADATPPLDVVAAMVRRREFREAVVVLRILASAAPGNGDQEAWLMLGEALEELGRDSDADAAYAAVIEVDEFSPVAEQAKTARSRLAEATFRRVTAGVERPDAVIYCMEAIQIFDGMDDAEVQRITYEIGLLGAGGLDVHDSAEKYRLRSLPGQFSGLHLVCLMYVGFKRIEPGMNVGFDLAREYEAARGMLGRGVDGS